MVLIWYYFEGEKMVRLNLRFPSDEFHNQLKSRAEQEEISLNKLIIKALAQYLKTSDSIVTQADLAPIRSELAELRQALAIGK